MKIHKAASLALALFSLSSTIAFADQFAWIPHVMPDKTKDGDHRINLWGGALISVVNDTDDPHYYNYDLNLISPDCVTEDPHRNWQESFTVAPHSTWQEQRDLNVAIQCSPGDKRIAIHLKIRQDDKIIFEKASDGHFTVR